MVFPIEELEPAVRKRATAWAALELRQHVRPVDPNHGKPVTSVEFESSSWLVEVTVWSSGEADVSTVRLTDDRVVNKRYELADRNDLDGLVDELVGLLVADKLPPTAVVFQWPGTPS